MAPRRPPGKQHDTAAGTDEVAAPVPPPPPPAATRRTAHIARADPARRPADDDLLDARERRQKAVRKPPGPSGGRLQHDDVRIDDRKVTETAPTDPE